MWMVGLLQYLWDAYVNTSERSFKAWMVETCRCWGIEVSSAQARFSAVAMTKSSGVTDGLVGYLCLKNAVPEIWVAQVDSVQWMCQGQTPFCSVLHRFDVCVIYCVQGPPSQLERMDVCCSHGGHRRAHRQISCDVVVIVGGEHLKCKARWELWGIK